MRPFALALLLVALVGCGGGNSPPPASNTVTYSIGVRVPSGGEIFWCRLVKLPSNGLSVTGGEHKYTPGSHHFLVFQTSLTDIPAGLEAPGPCYEESNDVMQYVRGVVYGAQKPEGQLAVPEGVGLKMNEGGVLLLQAHYLNATDSMLDAKVDVTLKLKPTAQIEKPAGVLFFYNPFIHVPAASSARASMRCLIRQDITILNAVSHYHKRGVSYRAFVDSTLATLGATPFYTSTDWSDPSPRTDPMQVSAGSRIRFECDYDNPDASREYFQGQSAEFNEMCMFTGLYYPAMDPADERCQVEADYFGTGTATCGESLSCVRSCPAGTGPTLGQGVGECWQRCITASCPTASRPLFDALRCVSQNCGLECITPGQTCTDCISARCSTPSAACLTHTCAAP